MMQIATQNTVQQIEDIETIQDNKADGELEGGVVGAVENFGYNKYPEAKRKKTDINKEKLKTLQKVWIAVTKFILSQCEKGRIVDVPFAGKFK